MERLDKQQLQVINQRAQALDFPVEEFLKKLASANQAYQVFTDLGPFYGADKQGLPPTFRICAEPVRLPSQLKENVNSLGQDIFLLGLSLKKLPDNYKKFLNFGLDFDMPISFRLDTILTSDNQLKVNEIQITDGADALMTAEQLAYGIDTLKNLTPFYLSKRLCGLRGFKDQKSLKTAWIRENLESPYTTNTKRMIEMIQQVSEQELEIDLLERAQLTKELISQYDGLINYTYLPCYQFFQEQKSVVFCFSDSNILGNKGIYPLVYDKNLTDFFIQELGVDALNRLRERFIVSDFIKDSEDLTKTKAEGRVAKIYWGKELDYLDRSRGVFGPWSSDEDWVLAESLINSGYLFINQDFVEPKRIKALLRSKGGKDLELVDWYNRICLKYVGVKDDNGTEQMVLTATEATLGSKVKPAGRDCSFTAVIFT